VFLDALKRSKARTTYPASQSGSVGAGVGAQLRSLNALCVYIPTELVKPVTDKVFRCNRERPRDSGISVVVRHPMICVTLRFCIRLEIEIAIEFNQRRKKTDISLVNFALIDQIQSQSPNPIQTLSDSHFLPFKYLI